MQCPDQTVSDGFTNLIPLTAIQRDVWVDCQLTPHLSKYNIGGYIVIDAGVDEDLLHQLFNELVARHDVLRLEIVEEQSEPQQRIQPSVSFNVPVVDFSDSENPQSAACAWMEQDMQRPFDLSQAPLWRFAILRLSEEQYCWYYAFHHLISDGVSLHLLASSLTEIYNARVAGTPMSKAPGFYELVKSDAQYNNSESYRKSGDFWEQQFQTIPPSLFSEKLESSERCGSVRLDFESSRVVQLNDLAASEGVSVFHIVQTLLFLYFSRTTDTNDVAIGVATHNRRRGQDRNTLGMFSQVIPLRLELNQDSSFADTMRLASKKLKCCYRHVRFPQGEVQRRIGFNKTGNNRVFDVELSFIPSNYGKQIIGQPATPFMFVPNKQEQTPLRVYCYDDERNGVLRFFFNNNEGYISTGEMQQIVGRFDYLLEQVIVDPHLPLNQYNLVPRNESDQLTLWGHGSPTEVSAQNLVESFEQKVESNPNAVALHFERRQLTYSELNNQANRIAHCLIGLGVKPETLVGICIERSPEMIIGLLAILKAGGAYVPIDADLPAARISYILEDSDVALLLTQEKLVKFLPAVNDVDRLDIDQELSQPTQLFSNPLVSIAPDSLAYVIYTSGSTGKPKGVMVEHRSLSNLLFSMPSTLNFTSGDRYLSLTNISFDISIIEIFVPLSTGGEVVLVSQSSSKDFAALTVLIQEEKPTHIQATPASWRGIHRGISYPQLKVVITTGEAVDEKLANSLSQIAATSYNLYGPTETTVWSTVSLLQQQTSYKSIGVPISNTQVYILDEHSQLAPPGVAGELYIGGAGLARGYLNRPELTAERFVELELIGKNQRLYRTGDKARWNEVGELEYCGRLDYQVKLRGHRIELGEIESVLLEQEQVEEALVVLKGEAEYSRLVGYVIPAQEDESPQRHIHINQWKGLWDSQYENRLLNEQGSPDFDFTGWTSSYTGEAVSEDEMVLWVDETVSRIRTLPGSRVLEIGCGTGLLLTRLAAEKERYVGLDFSESVLDGLANTLAVNPDLQHVELHQGPAHELSFLEDRSIDLVVINSVLQYFPDVGYLLEVINQLSRVCTSDARIFMGDIRNLNLLEAYHASVTAYKVDENALLEWASNRYRRAIQDEEELLLAPELFEALAQHWPGLARTELWLKSGNYDNEISRFRYDVCLTLGERQQLSDGIHWCTWNQEGFWRDELAERIKAHPEQAFGVRDIPDLRVSNAMHWREQLEDTQSLYLPIKDVRKNILHEGIDPSELYALADTLNCDLIWKCSEKSNCYQAIFNPKWEIAEIASLVRPGDYNRFANSPARRELKTALTAKLKRVMMTRLPEYMVPNAVVILEKFPLTPNGKVDRARLPEPGVSTQVKQAYVVPRNSLEQALAGLWKDILMLSDSPGVTDNFFDLGGHSLLSAKLASRVEEEFKVIISLKEFFKKPTIESVAKLLKQAEATAELKNVETSTYRWTLPEELQYKLESYLGSWEGTRASTESLIVGRNLDGNRPPLFWIFQGAHEFKQMAAYLGDEQPIYGTRSGHLIMDYTEDNIQSLALRYVEEIEALCPNGEVFIGGNCQAGMITLAIAQHLQRRQRVVPLTFLMEWSFGEMLGVQPHSGPIALLFGEESKYNPHLSYHRPELYWKRVFPNYSVKFFPGAHGQYFKEPNIQGLAETISCCMRDALDVAPLFLPRGERKAVLNVPDAPETLYADSNYLLAVNVTNASSIEWRDSEESGLMLGNQWLDTENIPVVMRDGRTPVPALKPGESIELHLPVRVPVHEGGMILNITLIQEGVCLFSGSEGGEIHLNVNLVDRPSEGIVGVA